MTTVTNKKDVLTGQQHYRIAEELLERVRGLGGVPCDKDDLALVALANVHATLAVAAELRAEAQ